MLISNGVIELTYEDDLERTMLASVRHLATDITTELSADMVFYVGGRHPQQPPWCVVLEQLGLQHLPTVKVMQILVNECLRLDWFCRDMYCSVH